MSNRKKPTKRKYRSPMQCRTLNQVCALETNNDSVAGGRISTDGYTVYVADQRSGQPSTERVSLAKRDFDALIRWYTRKQPILTKAEQRQQ